MSAAVYRALADTRARDAVSLAETIARVESLSGPLSRKSVEAIEVALEDAQAQAVGALAQEAK